MYIESLRIQDLRCLSQVELSVCAGLNFFVGPNGAGKTSVLEAVHTLGYGRSFRSFDHDAVIARGKARFVVYAESVQNGASQRIGFERGRSSWRAQANGDGLRELGELVGRMPVLAFTPDSHALLTGPAEGRRRFLDWLMFHVEPEFASSSRRYARCLRQRNAVLKQPAQELELRSWTEQLSEAGEALADQRARVFPFFGSHAEAALADLLPEMGAIELTLQRGWRDGVALLDRLLELVDREQDIGHTLAGPHRANWTVRSGAGELREIGSRGQQKSTAMAAVVAAARVFAERKGHPPVILLDDLCSELDDDHQQRVLSTFASLGAQLWVTGTHASKAMRAWPGDQRWFHVEQGLITPIESPEVLQSG